jgi:deoxyribodipyrimidine photolyase
VEEGEALLMLDTFTAQGLGRYEEERGFIDGRAVSRLSPYLHFGMLSPRLLNMKIEEAARYVSDMHV